MHMIRRQLAPKTAASVPSAAQGQVSNLPRVNGESHIRFTHDVRVCQTHAVSITLLLGKAPQEDHPVQQTGVLV